MANAIPYPADNPRLPTADRVPARPITTDGWYVHEDGTVGYWRGAALVNGPTITRCRARIPTAAEQRAEDDQDEAEYHASKSR